MSEMEWLTSNTLQPSSRKWSITAFANLSRVRLAEPLVGPLDQLTVYRLHLVTNTDVTAKGLD